MKTCMVDLDGVCCNFTVQFKKILDMWNQLECNIVMPTEPDVWHWDVKYYGEQCSKDAWHEVLVKSPEKFWASLPPLDKDGILKLALNDSHNVLTPYFVTCRSFMGAERVSRKWLEPYYIGVPNVVQSGKKGAVADAIDAEWAIDDKPENLIDILRTRGTRTRLYCPRYEYNKSVWEEPHITMVANLSEALEKEGL